MGAMPKWIGKCPEGCQSTRHRLSRVVRERYVCREHKLPLEWRELDRETAESTDGIPTDFSDYCGPAVVASWFGVSREEAVREIEACGGQSGNGRATDVRVIARAVGGRVCTPHPHTTPSGRTVAYPTVAQWLRAHPDTEAILLAAGHFLHVRNGRVVADNGYRPMRGRVRRTVICDTP